MKRLGKQRVEAWSILQILNGNNPNARWKNHPAVLMWEKYNIQLALYGLRVCEEWIKRGYKDTLANKFTEYLDVWYDESEESDIKKPEWFGKEAFHLSHRSNLLRKDFEHYCRYFGVNTPKSLPYIWPVRLVNGEKIIWKF